MLSLAPSTPNRRTRHQLRRLKLRSTVNSVLRKYAQMPPFIKSVEKISEKAKKISFVLFVFLIFNIATCVYQMAERVTFYLGEPTKVDTYFNEEPFGSFPYVYIYPWSTQELNDFLVSYTHDESYRDQCDISVHSKFPNLANEFFKYLSSSTYIISANITTINLPINLTMKSHDTLVQPATQFSSDIHFPYGTADYQMKFKLRAPGKCYVFSVMVHWSPSLYTIFPLNANHFSVLGNRFTVLAMNLQTYKFIHTKRNPCNSYRADCVYRCLLKKFSCKYPFYDARKLPPCNDTLSTYNKRLELSNYLLSRPLQCQCHVACDQKQIRETFNVHKPRNESDPTLTIKITNNYIRIMQENFIYDIISLLCDIGGNFGLYFGMSCLSIIDIFIYACKIPFVKLCIETKRSKELAKEIKRVRKGIPEQPTKKLYKILTFILPLCGLLYLLYNTINSYFDYPLTMTVQIKRDTMIQFPSIITCEDSDEIIRAKIKLQENSNTRCTEFKIYDLLHPSSTFANEPVKLWNAKFSQKLFDYHYYQSTRDQPFYGEPTPLSTVFGICYEFRKRVRPYSFRANSLTLFEPETLRHEDKFVCSNHQMHFILPQNEIFHPKYILYATARSQTCDIHLQTIQRVDTPRKSCESSDKVSKCEQKCYKTALEKGHLTCKYVM